VTKGLAGLWNKIKDTIDPAHAAVLSGASGSEPATAEERAFLEANSELAVRAVGSYLGHGFEPQFPMNIALAAVTLDHGSLFPPADASGLEKPMHETVNQIVVTGVGHWRGEGLALVERVGARSG
jgi:3-oxoacyl-[acyl-carrier-protein] synthase II